MNSLVFQYALDNSDLLSAKDVEAYALKVSDLPPQDKPREKLLKLGPKNLSLAELLAVLFGVGTKKEEVYVMSHRILREYGERAIVNETNPKRLAHALNIPTGKASQIVVSFELGRRFYQHNSGRPVFIRNAQQAYIHLKGIGESKKEQLTGLYLNSRYELVNQEVISIGSVNANIVHPREVFGPALHVGAVAVIIAHNHPSGQLSPSDADIEITEQLQTAGKILGIELLDHLIITKKSYLSLIKDGEDEALTH